MNDLKEVMVEFMKIQNESAQSAGAVGYTVSLQRGKKQRVSWI